MVFLPQLVAAFLLLTTQCNGGNCGSSSSSFILLKSVFITRHTANTVPETIVAPNELRHHNVSFGRKQTPRTEMRKKSVSNVQMCREILTVIFSLYQFQPLASFFLF